MRWTPTTSPRAARPPRRSSCCPGLVAFAVAVGASRLLPAVGRLAARRGRRGSARLAGVSLARSAGAAGIAAAFLALAVALAGLAETYRSTLQTGERDQAAFAVPTDVVVREDLRSLVPVLRAAPLERYAAIPGVEAVHPVTRLTASAGPAASVSGVTVLGVPPAALRAEPLWRDDWGATRDAVAEAVERDGSDELRGPILPGSDLALEVGPGLLSFRALLEQRDGRFRTLDLGAADPDGPSVLRARLPRDAQGSRLVGARARRAAPDRPRRRRRDRAARSHGAPRRGRLAGRLDRRGWGHRRRAARRGPGMRVTYAVTAQRQARVRPRQPTDDDPPTAVVTRALGDIAGGVGGTLPLRVGGETVNVKVGAVVDRIPGTTGDALVADREALATAVDTRAPGAAPVSELWLDVADGEQEQVEAALARRPFAVLEKRSRAALEADARQDPLGHGTLLALGAAALAALALAVWGLALAIRADLRDDRGELVDLEAQGATPTLLRRVVTARATFVAVVGVLAGIVGGVLLARLVTRVVSVTARASAPEPPLVTTVDPLVLLVAGVAFAVAAAGLVLLTTRRAFAEPRGPGRIGADA